MDVWGSGSLGVGLDWCLARSMGGGNSLEFWWGFGWPWVVAVGFNFGSVGWDLGGGGWLVQFWSLVGGGA